MSFRFLSRAPLALAIAAILVVPSAAVGATRDTQDTQTTTDTTVYDNATGGPVAGPLAVPASVYDGVSVSSSDGSTPVGSVEFFFSTTGCSGQFTSIGTGTLNESGVAASPDESDLGPGSYAFEAVFHGIESYGDSSSGCEPFVVGQTSEAAGPTVTKDATGSYTDTYSWTIEKSVDNSEIDTSGPATFTYTVSVSHGPGHVGNVQVGGTIDVLNGDGADETLASITDRLSNGTNCFVDTSAGLVVGPGDTRYAYSCDLGEGLPQDGVTNTVTIAWPEQTLDNGEHLAASSSTFSTPVSFAATEIDKCVDVSDPMEPGSPSPHHFCVGDTGDPNFSFSYSKTFTGDPAGTCTSHDNTATFTTNDTGATGPASRPVRVCVGADLTVSKTATASFDRTYTWRIDKSVDRTRVEQASGSVVFNYTVQVSQTGFSDGNQRVSGKITVHNPNDWEAITADVSDSLPNCTFDKTMPVTVSAGGSVDVGYSCPSDGTNGTNTATVTWDPATSFTPDGSVPGSADFAFTTPTHTFDKTITVSDSYGGPLGSAAGTDLQPFASATFGYSRTITVQPNCIDYPNTATINETGQSSSAKVTVCGFAGTGALTMGYWQNKNGQGIITAGASTGGVCNSGTWLRRYAPFQDLSATATCAQVAAYVTNVIKAASASGAAMNAMLKAQMLATALDVYFSDPGLGGNKINAPAPIGSVSIDLTKVNAPVGSGTYEDDSAAFSSGCETVSAALTDAASHSNPGGSVWYAQVKATQQLAKDAFDAVNNTVVFGCGGQQGGGGVA
jgi:hypothetical protein